ncbi:MAG TPA: metallophosphoesterase [Longimicrobium sp.]|nr:metallophosphoesterase [Longimicrobium sp.]
MVLMVALAWNGALWLVLGGLFSPVLPGGWRAVLALLLLLLLPLVVLARGIGGDAYPSAFTRVWVFRPFWYGQLALLLLAAAGLAGLLAGLPFGVPRQAGRWAVAGAGLIVVVAAIWGFAGTRRLVVRPLDVSFPDLPAGLDGMRVVQLSDLHVGPHTSRRHLARIAEAVRRADPDLVVLTGDQVDDYARDVEPLGRALGGLSAPLGIVAIPGNHDVYAGWTAVRRGMEQIGWTVLVNEAVPVERNGTRFWIAGTGDPAGGSRPGASPVAPDVERTLAAVPRDEFTLALAHNPALWPALAARGVELTLSGHTHHGQLAVPRLGWSVASVFLELAMGAYRQGRSVLYINPGTNFWGIPFRIGALPEVTVVTLHRAPVIPSGDEAARGERDLHGAGAGSMSSSR